MSVALTYALVIVVALVVLWSMQRRLMYLPDSRVPAAADVGLGRADAVNFRADDGTELAGWFVAAEAAGGITVLVFNGNAGNRAYRAPLATAFARQGFNVLLFDYRGYGGNPGTPSETGLAADARAARAYLASRADVDASRIVYFAESLGTGVAVRLAAEQAPAALVLRSPFSSMTEVGAHHYPFLPVRLLLRDRFPSLDTIRDVRSPLLVIAGDQDEIVPLEHSRRLYDAANEPKELLVIPGASHNDSVFVGGEEVIQAVVQFLERHSGQPEP